MKIDVHSHQIEKFFHDTLAALPGVTVKLNPDRFSYLMKDGKTWLPFRPEMFDPDHLIREMDRKGIDISILSMNTPSVYIFEGEARIALARRLNDSLVARAQRNPDRVRGFGTLPLPEFEPERVARLATIAVARRPGVSHDVLTDPAIEHIEMPQVDISSSMIRERVALGRPIRHLVPDPVRELIEAEGLYR